MKCICDENMEYLKRRLSSWKRWKLTCERYHCYYASVEVHQIKYVPWKAWLFMPSYSKYGMNIVKIGTDFYAMCSCSPICIFLCTVPVTLPRLGQISFHFDDSRTLQVAIHTNIYMLDDQPFLNDSTPFLSQCNHMTKLNFIFKGFVQQWQTTSRI